MNEQNNQHKNSTDASIDLGALFASYKRYWWMFAISLVACITLAGLYIYIKKPVYLVNAKVLISDDQNTAGTGGNLLKSFGLGGTGASVDDEVIVIKAQSICSEMVKHLKLNRSYKSKTGFLKSREYYNDAPIEINAPDALFDTLSIGMKFNVEINDKCNDIHIKVKKGLFKTLADINAKGFPVTVKTDYGTFVVDTTKYYVPNEEITVKAAVTGTPVLAEKYLEDLTIDIISKKAKGINLNLDETNVARGKDVLNKIIEIYNLRGQKEKDETAINTAKFITERLDLIYKDLSESEIAIEAYKKNNKLVDLEAEAQYVFLKKKKTDDAIMEIETSLSVLKMIKEFLARPENKYSMVPFYAESTVAEPAITQYNEFMLERQKLLSNAKPDNVLLKTYDAQIEVMRNNVIESANRSIESLSMRLDRMYAEEVKSGNDVSEIPSQERAFLELKRQQAIKNELYSFLLEKQEENKLVIAATTPKGKIVDSAFAYTEPIAPKKAFIAILALFMGILIPVVILYVKSIFTNRYANQEELSRAVRVPVIGELCHNRHKEYLVVRPGRTSSIVELFRLVRNNLQFMMRSNDKLILVTSSVSGEGKSFISTNIASSFALLEKKVLLIGLDIRAPKLAEYLNLRPSPGATNFFSDDNVTFDQLIQHTEIPNLDVVVAGPIPPNPSELLLRDRVNELFETAKGRYDYVIVDSAPIGMVSDTFSLARFSNVVLFVTRANYTTKGNISYLNQIVSRGQLKNVAAVLNDSNPKTSQGYGYGYGEQSDNDK